MKLKKIILVVGLLGLLPACNKTDYTQTPAEIYKNYSAEQLYTNGRRSLNASQYSQAIKYFEGLQSLYPFGDYAEKGQLDLIYAYYKSQEYAMAVAASDQYIHVYPRSENVDYAYYIKGLSQYYEGSTWIQRSMPIDMSMRDLTNAKQAFYDFRDLTQQFPNSKYAPDARQHMVFLRNMFAKYEMSIANYYYERRAYVAAANRASYVVSHYEHAPQVEDALVMLIKANRALGLNQPADDALAVLRTNYPDSRALRRL